MTVTGEEQKRLCGHEAFNQKRDACSFCGITLPEAITALDAERKAHKEEVNHLEDCNRKLFETQEMFKARAEKAEKRVRVLVQ